MFLIAGTDEPSVTFLGNTVRAQLSGSIMSCIRKSTPYGRAKTAAASISVFMDGISQPGIPGLTRPSRPGAAPGQGLPGQDLVWPGEFVLGYPGQDPQDP